MTRRRVPPGLRKAREVEKEDRRARRRATPSEEMREEVAQAFAPAPKEWSGKNDGTPGCLRTRRQLRLDRIYVAPGGCPWCDGTKFRHLPPDEHWPLGRPICLTCHPGARRSE